MTSKGLAVIGIAVDASEAAVLVAGRVVAAAREDRADGEPPAAPPIAAVRHCLRQAGIAPTDLDWIALDTNPRAAFLDLLADRRLRGFGRYLDALRPWMMRRLHLRREVAAVFGRVAGAVAFIPRAEALAASAFFQSSFDEAAIVTVHEKQATVWHGRDNRVQRLNHLPCGATVGAPELLERTRELTGSMPVIVANGGSAAGAALAVWHHVLSYPRAIVPPHTPGAPTRVASADRDHPVRFAARRLAEAALVAAYPAVWLGRPERGPREHPIRATDYFLESAPGDAATLSARFLLACARGVARSRRLGLVAAPHRAGADIPDEIYTLW